MKKLRVIIAVVLVVLGLWSYFRDKTGYIPLAVQNDGSIVYTLMIGHDEEHTQYLLRVAQQCGNRSGQLLKHPSTVTAGGEPNFFLTATASGIPYRG